MYNLFKYILLYLYKLININNGKYLETIDL